MANQAGGRSSKRSTSPSAQLRNGPWKLHRIDQIIGCGRSPIRPGIGGLPCIITNSKAQDAIVGIVQCAVLVPAVSERAWLIDLLCACSGLLTSDVKNSIGILIAKLAAAE
jgi:hypothetical protein